MSRTEWVCHVASTIPGAGLALAAHAGLISEPVALALFSFSFVGLNLAHMAATWSRVYLDPRNVKSALIERGWIPAFLVMVAICGEAIGYGAALLGAQYYLSLHHAMMQNYGLSRNVQRRSGRILSPLSLRIDQAACFLLPLGALLYRAREVCRTYSTATLWSPPQSLILAVVSAGAIAILLLFGREIMAHRRGERVDVLGPAIILSQATMWTVLPLVINHPAIPLYALASGHYVQYLYFVWKFEAAHPGLSVVPPNVRHHVAPPSKLAYFLALTGFGGVIVVLLTILALGTRAFAEANGWRPTNALPIPPWAAAMIGVNLAHYWLDHRIWRSKPAAKTGIEALSAPQPT